VRLDHVIYGTVDLDAAAARVALTLGLAAGPGGRHDGLGTHNRIVPLARGSFIELLAVADPAEAESSALGRALQARIARGDGWLGWAVAVADVAAVAARLGLTIVTVGRQGQVARLAGIESSLAEPALPFFIERTAEHTPVAAGAPPLSWVEVSGDADRLDRWLDGVSLPVRVVAGEPALLACGVGARELRTG
jgi:Glyoxalase-like domain